MNCDLAQERIVSAAYGELADDLAHELEQHLAVCAACREERESFAAFKELASELPVLEPDANLIARSRMRLEESLDALPPRSLFDRFRFAFRNGFFRMAASPITAAAVLLLGVAGGGYGGYRLALHRTLQGAASPAQMAAVAPAPASQVAQGAEVASVSSIVRQPGSGKIEVHYNQVVPQKVEGSIDDPAIRQLLMLASADQGSAGVRDDSVGLIAAECRAGRNCSAAGIRDALLVALRYDKSEAVREKALRGLEPYVAQDMRVRNAVLEALLNDGDARIRSSAINVLEPVEADMSVRQVLSNVATSDHNPHIRMVSQQMLNRMPEIQ